MTPRFLLPSLLAFAILAVAAHAQTPSPTPAPGGAASVAKPNCPKPGDVPSPSLASDNQRRSWQRDYAAWGECMKKFINDQRALAEPYNNASNTAIEDYNVTVKLYNDQIEKQKEAAK
ncbi:MAG: hypothetical protein ABIR52_03765 [Casimicrobiaceae bacterium]